MKRKEIIRKLELAGFTLRRHGDKHDIYAKSGLGRIPVPRHNEIDEFTARKILKDAGYE